MDPDSSLTDLFKNALVDTSKASNLPTIEEDTQVTFSSFMFAQYVLNYSFESYRAC